MNIINCKIYLNDVVIAVLDDSRMVIRILNNSDVNDVLNFIDSLGSYEDWSWETYSHMD